MLKTFEPDKKYIFSKEQWLSVFGNANMYSESDPGQAWISKCDGNEVIPFHLELGRLVEEGNNSNLVAIPAWCLEVTSDEQEG